MRTVIPNPSGEIKFYYGNMNGCEYFDWWTAGISDGNDENYHILDISHSPNVAPDQEFTFTKYDYPEEFEITEDGMLSGVPQQAYAGTELSFGVMDNNFIKAYKTLFLSAAGIFVQDSIIAGDDNVIEFGESAMMSVKITNLEEETINDATMQIAIQDDFITLIDSTDNLGTLIQGEPVRFEDAFAFDVASDVPNDHAITIQSTISTPDTSWESIIIHQAYAPVVIISETIVDDENQRLDPGDTTDIIVKIQNSGGAQVNNLYALLLCSDPFITINNNLATIVVVNPGGEEHAVFNISVSDEAENGHVADFQLDLTADNDFTKIDSISLIIGFSIEDFELGDFNLIDWGFDGSKDWQIDSEHKFEGMFSARSGYIVHGEESIMMLDMDVKAEGEISFYKKVSCEDDENNDNFDYLAFFIDGTEQQRWDGVQDWSLESFFVETGFHRFEWIYHKDDDISRSLDGAWIDYISFPPVEDAAPQLQHNPNAFTMKMRPDEVETDTLWITNTGMGSLGVDIHITSDQTRQSGNRNISGAYLTCSKEIIRSGQSYNITLTLYNPSDDDEWIEDLTIEFPYGMELTAAGDFVGGSAGNLLHDGTLGNGATVNWHGEDGSGWGVVKGGETATTEIVVYIYDYLAENISLNYEIHGDGYGTEPHIVNDHMNLRNLGPEIHWLFLDANQFTLGGGGTQPVILTYNSQSMVDGNYTANLLLIDNFSNEQNIPVVLTVDHLLSSPDESDAEISSLVIYPNPVSNQAYITFHLQVSQSVRLEIFDIQGRKVKTLYNGENISKGKHVVIWSATDDAGHPLPAGIYFCQFNAENSSHTIKIVLTK